MKGQLGWFGLLLACSLTAGAAEPWTLEHALDYALAHNPDAQIAQPRIALALPQLDSPQPSQ